MDQKTKLTVSGILTDLENGLTRSQTSNNYNEEIGCIQDKYNLTNYDLDMLFKHPKLKGRKTHTVKKTTFILEDDTPDVEEKDTLVHILLDKEDRNVETPTNNVVENPVIYTHDENHVNEVFENTNAADVNAGW